MSVVLFFLPFIVARFLEKNTSWKWFFSLSKELALSFFLAIASTFSWFFYPSLFIWMGYQIYLWVGSFLSYSLQIQMKVSWLRSLKDARVLIHWAKSLPRFYSFVCGGGLSVIYSLYVSTYVLPLEISGYLWIGGLFFTAAYLCFIFFGKKSSALDLSQKVDCTQFLSKNEIFEKRSSSSPLFRYTKGFTGEKLFSIDMSIKDKPHVIVVFLESFRAKNVGVLGGNPALTPNFDRLAKKGILFSRFYANFPLSHGALFSSSFGVPYPFTEGLLDIFLDKNLVGLPQLFHQHGYQNGFGNKGMNWGSLPEFLQAQGWDFFLQKKREFSTNKEDVALFEESASWLEKQEKPTFLTLWTENSHLPCWIPDSYVAPALPSHLSSLTQRYFSALHYTDYALGVFIDSLEKKKLLQKCLVIILGDHGQIVEKETAAPFSPSLQEESVHIPALILAEGRIQHPKIIDTLSSQMDLVPTLMDILQMEGFHHSMGKSLVRKEKKPFVYFQSSYKGSFGGWVDRSKYVLSVEEREKNRFMDDKILHAHLASQYLFSQNAYGDKRNINKSSFYMNATTTLTELWEAIEKNPNITRLVLEGISINDETALRIFSLCPCVQDCSFTNCLITDATLCSLPSLIALSIKDCLLITEEGISYVLENHSLEFFSLLGESYTLSRPIPTSIQLLRTHLSDSNWENWALSTPYLRSISLDRVTLSASALEKMVFPRLQEALLSYFMTEKQILSWLDRHPLLVDLFLPMRISESFLQKLMRYPLIRIFLIDKNFVQENRTKWKNISSVQLVEMPKVNNVMDVNFL